MAYKDLYKKYLSEIPADIEYCEKTGRRVVFGYTSDLDIVFHYNPEIFNKQTAKYLKRDSEIYAQDSMDSMQEFVKVLSAYLITGDGGECDINDYSICEYLNSNFAGTPGVGGTSAQGAAAMGAMGFPLIVHVTDKCREVCELMNYPSLYVIKEGAEAPIMEIAQDCTPVYHMIMEYTKGQTLEIDGLTIQVPVSNRLIMDYDKIHKDLHVDQEFRQYLEEHAESLISYNISGMNGILDADLLLKRLNNLDSHYRTIKEKNPNCIFYFESAHYLSSEVKEVVYTTFAKYVDILGMNEDELVAHARECGKNINKTSFRDIIKGLDLVQKKHGVNGIILHTKDYSMYYGNELKGIDIEKGLTIGNLMSGTRARTGRYGSRQDCEESLALPLSPIGLRFADELADMQLSCSTCLVPSRYMEKPKNTIGLGDTFVAGVQTAFIR